MLLLLWCVEAPAWVTST